MKEGDKIMKTPITYKINDPNRFAFPSFHDTDGKYIEPKTIVAALNELPTWQQFASHCRCCAISGDHDPMTFDEFEKSLEVNDER